MRNFVGFLAVAVIGCSAASQEVDVDARIAHIENGLLPALVIEGLPPETMTLAQRMADLKVPGVSIAVFNDGAIEWARGYGMADVGEGRPVTPRTLFQAASISKPVAATAALKLVQDGRLQLDEDVNGWLGDWKVPGNRFTEVEPVTLRRLVTHTAGMTVHGFPGYGEGERVPTTVEVLDGAGNTAAIRVDTVPGSIWRYSGGGYTVMQYLLTEVAGMPFPEIMRTTVLEPIGMSESTYEQPLPDARRAQAATGYRGDGSEVDAKWHTYPEMAAAGLWTTPSDLARFAIEVQRAYAEDSDRVISPEMAKHMLEPGMNGWGLGPAITADGLRFGHGGSNEGFRCQFAAFIEGGRGVAVMTNSDAGGRLMREIIVTVFAEYGWPGIAPEERTVADLDAALYPRYAGRYDFPELGVITIEYVDGRLMVDVPGETRVELLPESETVFFDRDEGTEVTFTMAGDRVTGFVVEGQRAEKIE
jgi:CubicO group peptidase (beta-lactamase class C family)